VVDPVGIPPLDVERQETPMSWSTRQLAELAGTTLKTVRHYHEVGLLEEPQRSANGYKRYQVDHLIRLLRIKRLVDLGVPLSQVTAIARADADPEKALLIVDAELASSIERLQHVRAELSMIFRHHAPNDLPPGFGEAATGFTDADRSLILIFSRILDQAAMDDLRQLLVDFHDNPLRAEFDALPPDADDGARDHLARRYARFSRSLIARVPWLANPATRAARSGTDAEGIITEAIVDLYNPAQLDVIRRSRLIVQA
jgi:DNA-binding transcriptional MerR regulator